MSDIKVLSIHVESSTQEYLRTVFVPFVVPIIKEYEELVQSGG